MFDYEEYYRMETNEMRIDDYREAVRIVPGVIDNLVPQLNDDADDTGERLAAAWRRIQRG